MSVCVFSYDGFHADWTYIALPSTEMFRVPFVELVGMVRQALGHLQRRIPEVEGILRDSGLRDEDHEDATSPVRFPRMIHRICVKFNASAIHQLTARPQAPKAMAKPTLPGF
jgi:hypothetical protein